MKLTSQTARVCLDCGVLTRAGSRCTDCVRQRERARAERRGTRTERGYDNAWLRIVQRAVLQQPWCSVCLHTGSSDNPLTGDHVVPRRAGGASTDENCRVLCRRCNSQRGAVLRNGRGRGKCEA